MGIRFRSGNRQAPGDAFADLYQKQWEEETRKKVAAYWVVENARSFLVNEVNMAIFNDNPRQLAFLLDETFSSRFGVSVSARPDFSAALQRAIKKDFVRGIEILLDHAPETLYRLDAKSSEWEGHSPASLGPLEKLIGKRNAGLVAHALRSPGYKGLAEHPDVMAELRSKVLAAQDAALMRAVAEKIPAFLDPGYAAGTKYQKDMLMEAIPSRARPAVYKVMLELRKPFLKQQDYAKLLRMATMATHSGAALQIIAAGKTPFDLNDGTSPLMQAITYHLPEVVAALLDKGEGGADLPKTGLQMIEMAAALGNAEMVDILLPRLPLSLKDLREVRAMPHLKKEVIARLDGRIGTLANTPLEYARAQQEKLDSIVKAASALTSPIIAPEPAVFAKRRKGATP